MSKRDVIDERMAQRFAWGTGVPEDGTPGEARPEEAKQAPPPAPAPPPKAAEVSEEEIARWKRARYLAAELAQDVARPRQMTAALPGFGVAARLVGKQPSLAILDALEHALAVTARDGAAAAEAAEALYAAGAPGAEYRRFDEILERAPAHARSSFASRLILGNAPLSPFQRHFIELLASSEKDVARPVLWALLHREPQGMAELVEDALPLVSHPEILAGMEEALGEPTEAETYWQDAGAGVDADDAADEPT